MRKLFTLAVLGLMVTGMSGCQTSGATDGAVIGTALGAGLGAIIGNQSGNAGEGALIGAGAGAITGAITGNEVEKKRQRQQQYYRQQPAPRAVAPAPVQPARRGHYENRIVESPNGEYYEERVWVPHN